MDILRAVNVTKYYGTQPVLVKALDGVTLSVEQGSFTAIVGTSGQKHSAAYARRAGHSDRRKRCGRRSGIKRHGKKRACYFP